MLWSHLGERRHEQKGVADRAGRGRCILPQRDSLLVFAHPVELQRTHLQAPRRRAGPAPRPARQRLAQGVYPGPDFAVGGGRSGECALGAGGEIAQPE
jgi:hypothetical protein